MCAAIGAVVGAVLTLIFFPLHVEGGQQICAAVAAADAVITVLCAHCHNPARGHEQYTVD